MLLSSGLSETGFGTFPLFLKYVWLLAEMFIRDEDALRNVFTKVHWWDKFSFLPCHIFGDHLLFKS